MGLKTTLGLKKNSALDSNYENLNFTNLLKRVQVNSKKKTIKIKLNKTMMKYFRTILFANLIFTRFLPSVQSIQGGCYINKKNLFVMFSQRRVYAT